MAKKHSEDYAFSCAVIRSNEKTFLGRADLIRVIEAKQMQGAMSVLAEFGYGDGKELINSRDFEKTLRGELARVYSLVFSIIPEKKELEMLLLPNDYHNVKVLLKSEFLKTEPDAFLVSTGTLEPEKIKLMVRNRDYIFMSNEMKDAIAEATEIFAKGRDPQEIDIIMDKACYKDMQRAAEATENEFLTGYVKLLIDILNLNTFIRLREIGKPWAFFQKVFLEGGNVDARVFTGAYEEPYQQFADRMIPYGLKEVTAAGTLSLRDTGKYSVLEKLCDDAKMKYIKNAKYISFGVEPVAAFLLAKESEVKNLRMVLTGKLTETPYDVLTERLRETYV